MGRRTSVVAGRDGARLFYDESVMRRDGAVPRPLRRTLFGDGAVHGMDDAPHEHRKAMFTAMLVPEQARAVARRAGLEWQAVSSEELTPVRVFDRAVDVHCAAICAEAGVPPDAVDAALAPDLIAMVDGFGSIGARHVHARRARNRRDRWAENLIDRARAGAPDGTVVAAIAQHRDEHGHLLPARVAGVELLNILRPTVAVSYFVAFSAHALQSQPELRSWLAGSADDRLEAFAHEVRRYYPFVPMLAARVRRSASFEGMRLPRGRRVLLNVYGMLHDPEVWTEPERFDPVRFLDTDPDAFAFLPQGAGDPHTGHRCPGERLAIELIKTAAQVLVARMPTSAERGPISMNRFPTRPLP